MKKILLSLLIGYSSLATAEGVLHDIKVIKVVDGDTISFEANYLPDPLKKKLSIRVYGVDTPEKGKRAKCEEENLKGEAASAFTENLVSNAKQTQILLMSWDKYGGRVLGDVLLDGVSLHDTLIEKGHARPYFGEAKQSWCNSI